MTDFSVIITQILILALTMTIGYVAIKIKYLGVETKEGLPKLIIRLLVPMLIINSITSLNLDSEMASNAVWVAVITFLVIVFSYLISMIPAKIFKIEGATKYLHGIISSCGNVIFLGYPVIVALFGQVGLFYAIVYSTVNDTMLWTIGMLMLAKGEKKLDKKTMLMSLANPETISFVIAVAMLMLGIKLPPVIKETVAGIGSATTYLSMMYVGMALAGVNILGIWKRVEIYSIVVLKMVIIPVALAFILSILGFEKLMIMVIVMEAAMPAQIVATILAKTYNADHIYAAECVVITIILSMITLPLVYMIASMIL